MKSVTKQGGSVRPHKVTRGKILSARTVNNIVDSIPKIERHETPVEYRPYIVPQNLISFGFKLTVESGVYKAIIYSGNIVVHGKATYTSVETKVPLTSDTEYVYAKCTRYGYDDSGGAYTAEIDHSETMPLTTADELRVVLYRFDKIEDTEIFKLGHIYSIGDIHLDAPLR